jgi:serine/threonine protein kinase/tetratricopeptide (TPR) repeat protein
MPDPAARWADISALFDELVDLAPTECERRLADIVRSDAAMAAELRALLAADEDGNALLDAGATSALPTLLDDAAPSDRRAGPYRLLRKLGEGGMGVVWLAERSDGSYEQHVAVKLLKRGMDTHAILRRFLQERRILARLHHAHIVRLVDGGMSADGRPFYVMDYVDGETITHYAIRLRLDVAARVVLLAKVAEAVAYAHTQLVVHRDLKPSNVLVGVDGEPRVLDFGIAKLIEESGEQTRTGTGLRVLSPAYAAPEQVLGEAIGTATDVYALGLMLCELLVGQLPQRRRASTPAQFAQDVAQETVERVSTLAAHLSPLQLEELYGASVTPAALARRIAGDIDVIVATALQREPTRRYPTAAAFADDLHRWLDRRPIGARADSGAYRLAKFVRRHRVGVAASVLIAASLVGGLGIALWQARVARAEAQRADAERVRAEHQLARTERVKDFMLTLFHEQDPVSRAKAQARSAPELIRDGIAQIDASFASDPDLRAELLRDLGEIQVSLDDRKGGQATLQRAWELQVKLSGADSAASAEALAAYGDALYSVDAARAISMLRDAVAHLRGTLGADDPKTAHAESSLAIVEMIQGHSEEAERLVQHALAVYRAAYGAHASELVPLLASLGKVQQERAEHAQSLASYGEALKITSDTQGAEHVRMATLRSSMGDVLRTQRNYPEALTQYETALRIERAQLPPGHMLIGGTLLRLGDLQRRMGRTDAADASFAEAITTLGKVPTGQYAQALQFHGDLATAQGRFDLAVQRYRAALQAFRSTTGDSIYTWLTALKLVQGLTQAGLLAEAEIVGSEAAAAIVRTAGGDSYESAYSDSVIGALRQAQGRHADAVPLLRHTLVVLGKTYGEAHVEVAQARVDLAASLVATREPAARAEAATLIETAKSALENGSDEGTEPMLGQLYLERSRLRLDSGDVNGARADIGEAIRRLQSPAQINKLRQAQAHAGRLGVHA